MDIIFLIGASIVRWWLIPLHVLYASNNNKPGGPVSMSTESSGVSDSNGSFHSLELPSMAPTNLVRQFGPGLILMMTGIGTSHLVTAPVAGGRFGVKKSTGGIGRSAGNSRTVVSSVWLRPV